MAGNVGRLKYVAGYYKYEEDNHTYNPVLVRNDQLLTEPRGTVDSKAFFGQLDYDFTDQWSASLGIRRSRIPRVWTPAITARVPATWRHDSRRPTLAINLGCRTAAGDDQPRRCPQRVWRWRTG